MGATLLSVNRPNPNGRSIKVSVLAMPDFLWYDLQTD